MEPNVTLASKNVDLSFVSFASNIDISQPLAFDTLFKKVANLSNLTFGNQVQVADATDGALAAHLDLVNVNNQSHNQGTNMMMQRSFSNIHNLTFPTPLLNSSFLSQATVRPSAAMNAERIHFNLQTLKYRRKCNPQNSTLNITTSKNDKMVEVSCSNEHEHSSQNEVDTLTVSKDISCEEPEETDLVVHGTAQKDRCSSENKENTPIVIQSKVSFTPKLPKDLVLCREKRKLRQTPKMAALTQSPSKLVRLKKALKPVVELTDWIIRPLPDCRGICVEGKRDGVLDFWHSTAITEMKTEKRVMTSSGSEYQLNGKINELCTIDSGFTADVAKAFRNGFPKNWKEVITQFYTNLEDSILIHEEMSFVTNVNLRKKFKSKQGCQTKKEAKQTSEIAGKKGCEKKSMLTNASKGTPSLKPAVPEEDMDSVLTPVGLVKKFLPTASLTVTRSGRLSLPPLARWSGQKYILRNSEIMVDFETNDARRAMMEETKAVYKLTKPFQKMLKYKNRVCLSPSMPTESLNTEPQNSKSISTIVSSKSSTNVTKIQSSVKGKASSNRKAKSAQQRSCNIVSNPVKSSAVGKCTRKESQKTVKLKNSPPEHCSYNSSKNGKKDGSTHSHQRKKRSRSHRLDQISGKENHNSGRRSSMRLKVNPCSVVLERETLLGEKKVTDSNEKSVTKITKTKIAKQKSRIHSPIENVTLKQKEKEKCKKTMNENRNHSQERNNKKNANKKRTRSDSHSPVSHGHNSTERKGQKCVDVTPKSTGKDRVLKKRRLNEDAGLQDSWSAHEIDCLQRTLRIVNSGSPTFWNEVASLVQTRTSEECQRYYTKYLEDKTADKFHKRKGKSQHLPGRQKGDPVQGKKGTMKRKKEIRAFLDEQNDDYEDNLFDGTPFASRKPISSLINQIGFDKGDEDIFGSNCNFLTPRLGHDKSINSQSSIRMPFASTKKTPACLGGITDSPASVKRVCADKYIHTFIHNKKKLSSGVGNNHIQDIDAELESSLLPKKSLFSTAGKASIFLEEDDNNDLHDDDEEDNRYMYYWNDLDCSH